MPALTRQIAQIFLFFALAWVCPLLAPNSGVAAVGPQGQVEGEVIQVFSTVLVIKDERGQATVLQVTPRTQLGGTFKPGDKVIAYVTPYGVTSVQLKTNTAQIP